METIVFFQTGQPVIARRKLAGVAAHARKAGWRVVAAEKTTRPFDVAARIRAAGAAGCVAECSGPHAELAPDAFGDTPVVYLCHDPARTKGRAACVTNDSPAVARLAAETFESEGLKDYGFVGWYEPAYWSDNKREALKREAAARNARVHAFPTAPADREDELGFRHRLADWLAGLPRPCGVLAVLDELAVHVLEACHMAGLDVPQDVSVLGVNDDETLCESTVPTLSSIPLDYERTGEFAAEILAAALGDGTRTDGAFTVQPVGVVRRQSTRRLTRPDGAVADALEFIRTHFAAGISARDVAARFPGSRRPAEIRFKTATGRTFDEEILRVRLDAAKALLANGRTACGAVASRCGWRSETLFRRQFKRDTGLSPLAWQKVQRKP